MPHPAGCRLHSDHRTFVWATIINLNRRGHELALESPGFYLLSSAPTLAFWSYSRKRKASSTTVIKCGDWPVPWAHCQRYWPLRQVIVTGTGNLRSMVINSCSKLSISFPYNYWATLLRIVLTRRTLEERPQAYLCTGKIHVFSLYPLFVHYTRDLLSDKGGCINTL